MSKHRHTSDRSERRAQFTAPATRARPSHRVTPVVIGIAILFLALVVIVIGRSSRTTAAPLMTIEAPAGQDVVLDAASFDDGHARFYRYTTSSGRDVRFFVMKSADGVLRAAFDACDVCYRERKGYRQAGDTMVCNNCGQRFPSTQINALQGGCNPAPIDRAVSGGRVTLSAASLERGVAYF